MEDYLLETKRRRPSELRHKLGNRTSAQGAGDVLDIVEVIESGRRLDSVNVGQDGQEETLSAIPLDGDDELRGQVLLGVLDKVNISIKDGITLLKVKDEEATPELLGLDDA